MKTGFFILFRTWDNKYFSFKIFFSYQENNTASIETKGLQWFAGVTFFKVFNVELFCNPLAAAWCKYLSLEIVE